MTTQLVPDALVTPIWRRSKPDALLHHFDRGSQYTSEQGQRLMTDITKRIRRPISTYNVLAAACPKVLNAQQPLCNDC